MFVYYLRYIQRLAAGTIQCHLPYPFSKPTIRVLLTTLYLGSQYGICIPIGNAINFAEHARVLATGCLYVGFSGGRTCIIFRNSAILMVS